MKDILSFDRKEQRYTLHPKDGKLNCCVCKSKQSEDDNVIIMRAYSVLGYHLDYYCVSCAKLRKKVRGYEELILATIGNDYSDDSIIVPLDPMVPRTRQVCSIQEATSMKYGVGCDIVNHCKHSRLDSGNMMVETNEINGRPLGLEELDKEITLRDAVNYLDKIMDAVPVSSAPMLESQSTRATIPTRTLGMDKEGR